MIDLPKVIFSQSFAETVVQRQTGESGAELGEGVTLQLEGGVMEHGGDMSQAQLDWRKFTPQEGGSEAGDQMDI